MKKPRGIKISIQNEMNIHPATQFLFSAFGNSVQSTDLKTMRHVFDLHLHTHYSADACGSPEAMVAAAKHKGLSGIALTDHNTCDAVEYLTRKGLIHKDGFSVDGFLIVPGVEVSTADGHLICLGATLPFMKGRPAAEVVTAIRERGGIAVAPHPFDRFRAGIRQEVLDDLDLAAIEVFNAAVTFKSFNEQAASYAERRGIAGTAGSDAHHDSAAGISSTAYDLTELSVADLLRAIPQGGTLNASYLPFREAMKKNFGNWFRLFNPKPKVKN